MDISQDILDRIEHQALRAFPKESCGLLVGAGGHILQAIPCANRARANNSFLIDPGVHLETQRKARGLGLEIIGCYHSHPGGDSKPSNRDWLGKNGKGFLWMVTSLGGTVNPKTRVFRQLSAFRAANSRNFVQERLQILGFVA